MITLEGCKASSVFSFIVLRLRDEERNRTVYGFAVNKYISRPFSKSDIGMILFAAAAVLYFVLR